MFDRFSTSRSSQWRCSVKKGVFKNFANFTGKHVLESHFNKVADFSIKSCNFIKISWSVQRKPKICDEKFFWYWNVKIISSRLVSMIFEFPKILSRVFSTKMKFVFRFLKINNCPQLSIKRKHVFYFSSS